MITRRRLLELALLGGLGAACGPAPFLQPGLRREDERTKADDHDRFGHTEGSRPHQAGIPPAAWSRRIGEPLGDPGRATPAQARMVDDGYWQGLPIGGLGSGSIGRTYRGDFARWHLDVGRHHYQPMLANQLAVRVAGNGGARSTVLCSERPHDRLGAWNWGYPAGRGEYHALFPRAWFVYDPEIVGCELTVEQFSPVIPGNYRESSYPVGVFEATAHNPQGEPIEVSLMLTWQNLVGWDNGAWRHAGQVNRPASELGAAGRLVGVVLGGPTAVSERWDGEFAIAAREVPGTTVSYRSRFRANGDGADLWRDFAGDGRLEGAGDPRPAAPGEETGAAVAVTFRLGPGERKSVPFALAWDLPIMQFGKEGRGRKWYRRYTAFYGTEGHHAWAIARDALAHYPEWRRAIDAWQAPILNDPDRPEWYKTALFNELYYLVDGGTAWENGEVGHDGRQKAEGSRQDREDLPPTAYRLLPTDVRPGSAQGRFTYLECYDYPFYSTLDVRFYSSWALLMLWPELEKQEIRQFAATVDLDDPTPATIQSSHARSVRKRRGALPHDLGGPGDDPWVRPNSYAWQDINIWKDLNSKFVLQVYRDYVLTGDRSLLTDCWPGVKSSLAYLKRFDRDGDGIPQNDGVPDQTYDTWPMTGPSAYCGGLWLAALRAAEAMAELVGDSAAGAQYRDWRRAAEAAYERLWNGRYYDFDSSRGGHSDTIMADQLCGQWYAQAVGLPDIVPAERVPRVLQAVYDYNVRGFAGGRMGAVNGMRPDGTVDRTCDQSQEVWTGVSYALAAFMIQNGMVEEALSTARGLYDVTYVTGGFWFRTPEAWDEKGEFRASMYMRPQAIWAMEHALRLRPRG